MNTRAGLFPCCVFPFFQLQYFFPFQSTANYREQYRISFSGEIGVRFLGGSCEVTSTLIRQILYQHRVIIISIEIEDLKLKRRHHQITHQTGGWFKDNTLGVNLMVIFPFGSLCVCRCKGQTNQIVFSHAAPFWGWCFLAHWHTCDHSIFYIVTVTERGDIYSLSVIFAESHFGVLQLQAELEHCLMFPSGSKNWSFKKCWEL